MVMALSPSSHSRPHPWQTMKDDDYEGTVKDSAAKCLRQRLLSGPTVNIFVGPQRRQWSVHRRLLCHHSSYFDDHASSENDSCELPDEHPRGFELLVRWLYQGSIDNVSTLGDENEKYEYAVSCHKLWLLCHKFGLPELKDVALEQYRQGLCEAHLVPDAEEINEIYAQSPPGSPFRSLMTKIAARQIMDPEVDKDAESYRNCFEGNPDFAVDMVNAIRHMSGGMLFDDPTAQDYQEKPTQVPAKVHNHRRPTNVGPPPPNTPTEPQRAPIAKGTPKTTPNSIPQKQTAGRSFSHSQPPRQRSVNGHGTTSNGNSSRASSICNSPRKLERRSTVAANTNEPPSAQKAWTVNGVVKQMNGNGESGSQGYASSTTSTQGRRQPPKLRKKEAAVAG